MINTIGVLNTCGVANDGEPLDLVSRLGQLHMSSLHLECVVRLKGHLVGMTIIHCLHVKLIHGVGSNGYGVDQPIDPQGTLDPVARLALLVDLILVGLFVQQ